METIDHIRNLPELRSESIQIWGIHVPDMVKQLDVLQDVLCDREKEKSARFRRETDRHSSVAARAALRILLSGYTGIAMDKISFNYSENGKPHMAGSDVEFNVSHSSDWVVLAMGRDRSIGVDIEKIKREIDVGAIASRYFAAEEVAILESAEDLYVTFFQLWTRKEAYVKACGSTLFTELRRMAVPVGDGVEKDGWFFHHIESGSQYAAAVVTDKPLDGLPCYDFGGLKWHL